jgi:bifunctional DNA-binding transcriptional regulator/antitoxin component of YhaV-PrlF toxin-antitoxin module
VQKKRKVRTLQQNNTGTMTVSIPVEMVRELGWSRGQRVVVNRQGDRLVIENA